MTTRTNRVSIAVAVAAGLAMAATSAHAQNIQIWRLTNNTGRVVNDLHAIFGFTQGGFNGGLASQQSQHFGSADRFVGGNRVIWDPQAGQSIDPGGTDRVEMTFQRVTNWNPATSSAFWTWNGENVGAVQAVKIAFQGNGVGLFDAYVVNDTESIVQYDNLRLASGLDLGSFVGADAVNFGDSGLTVATAYDGSGSFAIGETLLATGLTADETGYLGLRLDIAGERYGAAVIPSPASSIALASLGLITTARRRRR